MKNLMKLDGKFNVKKKSKEKKKKKGSPRSLGDRRERRLEVAYFRSLYLIKLLLFRNYFLTVVIFAVFYCHTQLFQFILFCLYFFL